MGRLKELIMDLIKMIAKAYGYLGFMVLFCGGFALLIYGMAIGCMYFLYLPVAIIGWIVYFITGDSTILDYANTVIVHFNAEMFN